MRSLVAHQLARRFSVQRDSQILRERTGDSEAIIRSAKQRADMVRRGAHWPTRERAA